MKIERTKNALRNTKWGVVQRAVHIFLPFLVRTVLIYTLCAEYSGLSSLFTSILQVLSLTELGISNAIVFSMYKPIAEENKDKICAILNYYRKAYLFIGVIILLLGLSILPVLPKLIKDDIPSNINLYALYLVYLFNTVISYFLYAYKTCLLTAHQRADIISKNTLLYSFFLHGFQCLSLLLFRNFYCYVVILPVSTVVLNLLNNRAVNKLFPEYKPCGFITEEERKELKKKVLGLAIWKIGGATRNTFDSIVASAYLGLIAVTIYNNYFYILNGVNTILGVITSSIIAGVGNKIATESKEENYQDFLKFHFLYMWIAGWCCICMMCLYQPFMRLWMGETLMLPNGAMLLFCYLFLMMKQGDINSVYYQAAGLWWFGKIRSIIEAGLNLVLNLILGKYYGITGILFATIISFTCVYFYGSKFVFTEYFKNGKRLHHYLENMMFFLVTILGGFITCYIGKRIIAFLDIKSAVIILMVYAVSCLFVPNIIFWGVYSNNKRYRTYIMDLLHRIMQPRG